MKLLAFVGKKVHEAAAEWRRMLTVSIGFFSFMTKTGRLNNQ
jgi:hypothetical protein